MNKINHLVKFSDSTSERNHIQIMDASVKLKHRVKFFRDGIEAKDYTGIDKVDKTRNSAEIFLDIDRGGRKNYEEDEGTKIIF
jgi:hypothetical protein